MPGVSLDNFSEWSSKLVKHIVILGLFREFMMLAVWFCIAEVLRVKIILEENLGNKKKHFKKFLGKRLTIKWNAQSHKEGIIFHS